MATSTGTTSVATFNATTTMIMNAVEASVNRQVEIALACALEDPSQLTCSHSDNLFLHCHHPSSICHTCRYVIYSAFSCCAQYFSLHCIQFLGYYFWPSCSYTQKLCQLFAAGFFPDSFLLNTHVPHTLIPNTEHASASHSHTYQQCFNHPRSGLLGLSCNKLGLSAITTHDTLLHLAFLVSLLH